jgi:dihydrofolate reductase
MSKIIVTEFLTLDGVMEAPNEWSFPYWSDEIGKFKFDELFASGAQLLGRVTYEGFAAAWPGMRDDEAGFGERMNSMPKYVVSTTLDKAEWENSHIIKGNLAEEVGKLKQQTGQDILVAGSAMLIQALIKHNLVDQYNLLVYPIVVGKGKRLFQDGAAANLKLVETRPFDMGVVAMIYQPAEQ